MFNQGLFKWSLQILSYWSNCCWRQERSNLSWWIIWIWLEINNIVPLKNRKLQLKINDWIMMIILKYFDKILLYSMNFKAKTKNFKVQNILMIIFHFIKWHFWLNWIWNFLKIKSICLNFILHFLWKRENILDLLIYIYGKKIYKVFVQQGLF